MWQAITRVSALSRASGVSVFDIRKELSTFLHFSNVGEKIMIRINCCIREIYLVPVYFSEGNREMWEVDFIAWFIL